MKIKIFLIDLLLETNRRFPHIDQAAFLAQKDTAGGCKTMKQYLWKVCGDEYDQQHGN